MKKLLLTVVMAVAPAVYAADIPVQRVYDDAKVMDRVAEATKRDLPRDLLKRILNEDIEWLRGKRADGTYDYATFERLEESRNESSYSVQARKDDSTSRFEMKGSFVYRLIVQLPTRRMLVTKNRRVYIDRVDLEYVPMNNSATQMQSVKVGAWMNPGEVKPVDFPEVARQATVRVYAKGDPAAGYGNIDLILIHAKVIDNADSPYADAVASAKAIQRAIDSNDIPSIRAMAARMRDDLAPKATTSAVVPAAAPAPAPATTVEVVAPKAAPAPAAAPAPVASAPPSSIQGTPTIEIYSDLQSIEDLLTGTESEKREGLEKLHQLVRRLRPH